MSKSFVIFCSFFLIPPQLKEKISVFLYYYYLITLDDVCLYLWLNLATSYLLA